VTEGIARDGLLRSVPFTVTRAAGDGGDGLTLDGYAAVFNRPTIIDSWEGRFSEQVARGAFRKSIAERTPRLQFDHGYHPIIGDIPIGRVTDITEDTQGLHVIARLTDNWLVQPVRDAIAEGAIDGMSFRFDVIREEWRDEKGKLVPTDEVADRLWQSGELLARTLKELKVPELGPVVWPAYTDTSVGVRSTVTIDLGRITSDPEQRRKLAGAVFAADLAEQRSTGSTETADAPPPAGHPSEEPTPPAPSDAPPPEGHPSADATEPPHQARLRARIRAQAQAQRDLLTHIDRED